MPAVIWHTAITIKKIRPALHVAVQSYRTPTISGPNAANKYPTDWPMPESSAALPAVSARRPNKAKARLMLAPCTRPIQRTAAISIGKEEAVSSSVSPVKAVIPMAIIMPT